LDGVGKLQIKISGFRPHIDTDTTYIVDGVLRVVPAEIENMLPYAPVGVDAKEALAQGDKDRYVEDRVGGQLMKMNPIK
jgi:hypothetical protein